MTKAKVEITADGLEKRCVVDGLDISQKIKHLTLFIDQDETVLGLELMADVEFNGEAVTTAWSPGWLAESIKTLNTAEIEAEALTRMGWGETATLTSIIVQVITEKLSEAEARRHPQGS